MRNRIADTDNKIRNRIFAIFVWILTGLFVAIAGTAMIVSGSFNLDCFYNSGEVYEVDMHFRNIGDKGLTNDNSKNCLIVSSEDAIKTFDLSNTQKKWKYILLNLSKLNTNIVSSRADFYDRNNNCVAQQNYELTSGENILDIQNVAYSKVVFHFVNQKNTTFYIDKAQFREKIFTTPKNTAFLYGVAIFGVYLFVTGLVGAILKKIPVKPDWYLIVSWLQMLYCKLGNFLGKSILPNLSRRMKSRHRIALFCIMILNMQVASVLNLYENSSTYRYEMLANAVIILLVACLCWERELRLLNWKNKLVGAWLTLWIMAIISDLIVNKRYAYTGYMMLLVVGFLFFLWGNMEHKERLIWDFIHAIEWNFLINAIFCYLFRPYTPGIRYNGGSYGPGSWGLYLLFVWCAFFAELDYALGHKGNRKRGLIALVGASSVACFLWKAQSVSSILPALVVALAFSLRWWIYQRKNKILIIVTSIIVFAGAFGLSSYGIYKIPRMVDREVYFKGEKAIQPVTSHPLFITVEAASIENSRIYQKLINSTSLESLTSGRNLYWEGYLRKMNFFGHANKVFLWGSNRMPHNGFLAIMYRYGIFAGIPYIVMIIYNLVCAFRYFVNSKNKRGTNFFVVAVAIAGTMLLPVENLELPFYWLCWFAFYFMMGSYFDLDKGEHIELWKN